LHQHDDEQHRLCHGRHGRRRRHTWSFCDSALIDRWS
jgi:hypothetical protein